MIVTVCSLALVANALLFAPGEASALVGAQPDLAVSEGTRDLEGAPPGPGAGGASSSSRTSAP